MPSDTLALLSHGLSSTPDGTGSVHDIAVDGDVLNIE